MHLKRRINGQEKCRKHRYCRKTFTANGQMNTPQVPQTPLLASIGIVTMRYKVECIISTQSIWKCSENLITMRIQSILLFDSSLQLGHNSIRFSKHFLRFYDLKLALTLKKTIKKTNSWKYPANQTTFNNL